MPGSWRGARGNLTCELEISKLARMYRRMSFAAALMAPVLMAAGCGTGSGSGNSVKQFAGEQRAVATAVEDLQSAGSKGKPSEICDHLLSKSLVDQITRASHKSCTDAVDTDLKDADAYDLTVLPKGVTVTGTSATARVRSKNGSEQDVSTLKLVKEAGRWKISEIGQAAPTN